MKKLGLSIIALGFTGVVSAQPTIQGSVQSTVELQGIVNASDSDSIASVRAGSVSSGELGADFTSAVTAEAVSNDTLSTQSCAEVNLGSVGTAACQQ